MQSFKSLCTLIAESPSSGAFNQYRAYNRAGTFTLWDKDTLLLSYHRIPNYRPHIKIHSRINPLAVTLTLKTLDIPDYCIEALKHQDQVEFD